MSHRSRLCALLCVVSLAGAAACGDDAAPPVQEAPSLDGGPDGGRDVDEDAAVESDAGREVTDASLADDGGLALDSGSTDDGGFDAGDADAHQDDGGSEPDGSSPPDGSIEDDGGPGRADGGEQGIRVSSPLEIPGVASRPDRSACTEALFGAGAVRYPRTQGSGAQRVVVEQITYCAPESGDGSPYWELGPQESAEYSGQPVRTTWGTIVSFHEDGAYQGTLRVSLLEGESQFMDITCVYGRRISSLGLELDRSEPTTLSCPTPYMSDPMSDWRRFGSFELRTGADVPTAVFRPADGTADVPVKLFAL